MINLMTSTLSSSLRCWAGTSSSKVTVQPGLPLILYDREACPRARLVREALTELNLDVEIRPCPLGSERFINDVPTGRTPYLLDPNTQKTFTTTGKILHYLFYHYAGKNVPAKLRPGLINLTTSSLASTLRLNAGNRKKPGKPAARALRLFSFESSPYSRPVRELLSELELRYLLINIGKQQWSDMGPANFRLGLGQYMPLPDTKRSAFFAQHGNVQVPYLEDPNTDSHLFESKDIIEYLNNEYATL
ncbi:glutathione S-transferase N-terminal domain-containing protein [Candidatus Sororendozoicomonas aggregata]|uniref:glutathione S-transferase N-terminal domain-containing protein n=1 Tax=Candidatus Sororendozoicomonas aggregata TaxID=3073239 RepID=UPI002ED4DC48